VCIVEFKKKEKEKTADIYTVILVQAENEFSASANHDVYMQDIIDLYRSNGIVVRESRKQCFILYWINSLRAIIHNDQHAGQAGNFSPDLPGTHVDIYWCVHCSLFRCISLHQNSVATLTLKAATIGPKYSPSIILLTKLWHRAVLYVWPRFI